MYQSPLRALKVEGADRHTFLQGQLSCDVFAEGIQPALYCNRQGRILADLWLCQYQETLYLLMHDSLIASVQSTLKHFAMFSKVLILEHPFTIAYQLLDNDLSQAYTLEAEEARLKLTLPGALTLTLPLEQEVKAEQEAPENLWQWHQIKQKVPHIEQANTEKYLPHRLHYHELGYINFKKGCYLGQEIIARMHYKSEIKHLIEHIIFLSEDEFQQALQQSDVKCDVINQCHFNDRLHLLVSYDKKYAEQFAQWSYHE